MNSKKFNILMTLIGSILLLFLLGNLNYSYIKRFHFSFTIINVAVLLLLIFSIFVIRTFRWIAFLRSCGIHITLKDAYFIVVPSIALALFTPAQTGDLLKIEFLKRSHKIPRRESFATVFVEKAMDFALIFVVFLFAIGYYSLKTFSFNYGIIVFALFIAASIVLVLLHWMWKKKRKIMVPIIANIKRLLQDHTMLLYTLFLTVLYWTLVCLNWIYVAKVVGISIGFFQMLGVLSIATMLGLISLIPGGLGVMDYGTVLLLHTFMNIQADQGTVFVLSYRLYTVVTYGIAYLHLAFRHRTTPMGR